MGQQQLARTNAELRILVVEDEQIFRDAVVFELKRRGFQVFSAAGGNEALAFLRTQSVHVIITDICMPNGDGIELLDKARVLKPDIPVIMLMTGFSELSVEEAQRRGADALFRKPIDRRALLQMIGEFVGIENELIKMGLPTRALLRHANHRPGEATITALSEKDFSVQVSGPLPQPNETIDFTLEDEDKRVSISGSGVVKWMKLSGEEAFSAVCGVEITYISVANQEEFLQLFIQTA